MYQRAAVKKRLLMLSKASRPGSEKFTRGSQTFGSCDTYRAVPTDALVKLLEAAQIARSKHSGPIKAAQVRTQIDKIIQSSFSYFNALRYIRIQYTIQRAPDARFSLSGCSLGMFVVEYFCAFYRRCPFAGHYYDHK